MLGPRGSTMRITLARGRRIFGLELKRGSWGPEHAIVSDEERDMSHSKAASAWSLSHVTPTRTPVTVTGNGLDRSMSYRSRGTTASPQIVHSMDRHDRDYSPMHDSGKKVLSLY